MSKFTSTKAINSRWRNNDFVGAAGSTHTFPDQFHDEFLVDWALQISDGSIVITETPTTGNIQMAALTVGDITLTGTASGFPSAPTINGTSPINVVTASGTSTISVSSGTTSTTVSLGNHAHAAYVSTAGDTVTGGLTISNTGSLAVFGATSTANTQVTTRVDGDTSTRWGVRADGFQAWGDGTAARDTNLYRSAANTLATDDNFDVGQDLTVGGDIIHTGQLDFSAGGAVAASVTSAGIYFPASKRITFEGATDDGFETLLTVADATADRTITLPDSTGTVALTANKLSAFAATSSSELAGVISDETGTGSLVFGTSPTLDGVTLTATASTPVIHGIVLPATHGISFEGATADAFETTLTVEDPTADRTITLPNLTGTISLTSHTHTDVAAEGWEAFTFGSSGIAATHPRFDLTTSTAPSSGNIQHSKIIPHRDFVVSNIAFVSTAATASVPTLIRFGIYTRSGTTFTLVARTASDTTIFNAANTKFTRALDTTGGYPATYTLLAGTEYFISVIQVASVAATLLTATTRQTTVANAATGVQLYQDSGEADLVASSTGSASSANGGIYAEVS